jgi:hypothetical protein
MSERYEPASDFLKAVIAENVPLSDGEEAAANLRLLIAMTRDADTSNRDWATLLLSQTEIDIPEVRAALLNAAEDTVEIVRAEAILGLAQRDTKLALPLLLRELAGETATMPLFEAAELIADPILVDSLLPWTEPSGNQWLDDCALNALKACERCSGD